jgi:hypothetical protein
MLTSPTNTDTITDVKALQIITGLHNLQGKSGWVCMIIAVMSEL